MAWIVDSLRSAIGSITGRGGYGYTGAALPNVFTHQLALVAYMSSGMLRKVIAIPADDRVREWRDWQAPKDDIALIEAEEARLGLQAKVKQAEILRGIGGGALILVTAGDHSQPLDSETIKEGGLVAINVVSRWQITGRDWIRDLASPDYGKPAMWEVASDGKNTPIHPSRVVCFRGEPIPAGAGVSDEEAFWGDSRLLRVYCEVARSDKTQERIAQLVEKAKLTRIGIPDLDSMDDDRLQKRVALIAEGEGIMNATVFRSAGPNGDAGETITDYQITWNGIPDVMDAFDQRVAAVADIPFTRLMGRSPAGMNSTGQHDTDNWNKMVGSGQNLETRPCLVQIDPILLRSAGVSKPDDVTWKFAPLWTPTEKEEADTFKTTMDAVTALMNTGSIPEEAFNEAVQNLLTEREYLPGLDQALDKVPENERFAGSDDPTEDELDHDPSAITATAPNAPRRRVAANDAASFFVDAKPRPLYVQRKLLNASELIAWAKDNGFTSTLPASDMHVTVLYSRTAVDPMKMGEGWSGDDKGQVTIKPGGPRAIERLGENAVVLLFASTDIQWRHEAMVRAGGSHDYEEYQPHVTISYDMPADVDLATIKPFAGKLVFGPELFEPLDLDWKSTIVEDEQRRPFGDAKRRRSRRAGAHPNAHYDPSQPRGTNGRWIPYKVRSMLDEAAKGPSHAKLQYLGRVGATARERLAAIGLSGERKTVSLDGVRARHIFLRHGQETRARHVDVKAGDMASAATILNTAKQMRVDRPAPLTGNPRVIVKATMGRHDYFAVFESRKKTMALITMWKRG